jgi:AraC-like DNA-binding protein
MAIMKVDAYVIKDSVLQRLNDRVCMLMKTPDVKQFETAFQQYAERMRKVGISDNRYYAGYMDLVTYYLMNNRFYKATTVANQTMDEIRKRKLTDCYSIGYDMLGNIFMGRGDKQKAYEYARLAIKNDPHNDASMSSYYLLSAVGIMAREYPREARGYALEALKYSIKPIRRLSNFTAVDITAFYLNDRKLYEQMKDSITSFHVRYKNQPDVFKGSWEPLLSVFDPYFRGDLQKAIAAYEALPPVFADPEIALFLYEKSGNTAKQVQILKKMIATSDSLHNNVIDDYLTELNTSHLVLAKQKEIDKRNLLLAISSIIMVVLLLFIIGTIRYFHIQEQQHRAAADTINDLLAYKERAERMKTGQQPSPVTDEEEAKESDDEKSLDQQLYEKIERLIVNEKLYLRADLTRDDLLNTLHISKNKFTALFKEYGNTAFLRYVNNLRMEYAAQLLKNKPEYTIDAIAMESGINPKNFYRVFADKYGITPSEYRRQLKTSSDPQ